MIQSSIKSRDQIIQFTIYSDGIVLNLVKRGKFHDNFPGFGVSDFAGTSRAKKLKAWTKQLNITGVTLQYIFQVSTGSGVNFPLSFLLISLCANSHLSPLSMDNVSCCHYHHPTLKLCDR